MEQWFASPACTELEAVVMDWAAKMFGLHSAFWNANEVGGGVIQVRYCFFRSKAQFITSWQRLPRLTQLSLPLLSLEPDISMNTPGQR